MSYWVIQFMPKGRRLALRRVCVYMRIRWRLIIPIQARGWRGLVLYRFSPVILNALFENSALTTQKTPLSNDTNGVGYGFKNRFMAD